MSVALYRRMLRFLSRQHLSSGNPMSPQEFFLAAGSESRGFEVECFSIEDRLVRESDIEAVQTGWSRRFMYTITK